MSFISTGTLSILHITNVLLIILCPLSRWKFKVLSLRLSYLTLTKLRPDYSNVFWYHKILCVWQKMIVISVGKAIQRFIMELDITLLMVWMLFFSQVTQIRCDNIFYCCDNLCVTMVSRHNLSSLFTIVYREILFTIVYMTVSYQVVCFIWRL